ncbi:F-box/WD repeat-containing protein pof11 [Porphyridium purpureum]|uniref:F-box/WD repeat-containing protein pof11 n=1 Tax=Porphyridium purpureum TaxID=35688 RepID=A0A5J4YHW5_PORPP|nr:F-box/WD repeat-containing protein pof11 [Porphyridium purpureum]|eukprot:POR6102..scf297_16
MGPSDSQSKRKCMCATVHIRSEHIRPTLRLLIDTRPARMHWSIEHAPLALVIRCNARRALNKFFSRFIGGSSRNQQVHKNALHARSMTGSAILLSTSGGLSSANSADSTLCLCVKLFFLHAVVADFRVLAGMAFVSLRPSGHAATGARTHVRAEASVRPRAPGLVLLRRYSRCRSRSAWCHASSQDSGAGPHDESDGHSDSVRDDKAGETEGLEGDAESLANSGAPKSVVPDITDTALSLLADRIQDLRELETARDRRRASNWRNGKCSYKVCAFINYDFVRKLRICGDLVAFGSCAGRVFVYNMRTQQRVAMFMANFVSSEKSKASGVAALKAIPGSQAPKESDRGRSNETTALDFWNGELIISGARNGLISALSLSTRIESQLEGHSDTITGILIAEAGRVVFSTALDGMLKVQTTKGELLRQIDVGAPVLSLCMSDDYVLVGTKLGNVLAYVVRDLLQPPRPDRSQGDAPNSACTPVLSFEAHGSGNVTAMHAHNSRLVTAAADGELRVWSLTEGGPPLQCFHDHSQAVIDIQCDEHKIVSAARDGTVRVRDFDGSLLYALTGFTKYIGSARYNDNLLVTDGTNNVITVHDFSG